MAVSLCGAVSISLSTPREDSNLRPFGSRGRDEMERKREVGGALGQQGRGCFTQWLTSALRDTFCATCINLLQPAEKLFDLLGTRRCASRERGLTRS
jgi:hypothetical protein